MSCGSSELVCCAPCDKKCKFNLNPLTAKTFRASFTECKNKSSEKNVKHHQKKATCPRPLRDPKCFGSTMNASRFWTPSLHFLGVEVFCRYAFSLCYTFNFVLKKHCICKLSDYKLCYWPELSHSDDKLLFRKISPTPYLPGENWRWICVGDRAGSICRGSVPVLRILRRPGRRHFAFLSVMFIFFTLSIQSSQTALIRDRIKVNLSTDKLTNSSNHDL